VYKDRRVIAVVPAHNESGKIGAVLARLAHSVVDSVLVVDDGSTDDTAAIARRLGAHVLALESVSGVGAALRAGFEFAAAAGFEVVVILAGNNKDDPAEIPRLLDPICSEDCDFVIGSRYLPGGCAGGEMPRYRRIATRLHPWLMGFFARRRLTESTNGFRALRLAILADPRINLHQRWLSGYGLEVYLLWKVLKLGYRHKEVPCTKTYPPKALGQTKMTPIIGWWSILRPVLWLGLGLRR
jgi:dolichol-phosphate mannosyltransferase